jgi:hypothetical protein
MQGLDLADLTAPFDFVRCCVMTPLFTPVPVISSAGGGGRRDRWYRSFPMALLNEFKSIQTDDVVCGLFVSLFMEAEVRTFRVRWHRFCFATNAALIV